MSALSFLFSDYKQFNIKIMDILDFLTDENIGNNEPLKMTSKEFVEKTQKLLMKIEKAFSESLKQVQVPNEFLVESQCQKCECGECVLKIHGIEQNVISNEDGYCTYYGNTESMYDLMQEIIFEDSDTYFYELLYSEVVDNAE